ncbi:MAG: class I SAM-dependent methyltransferase [Methyloligellaceae bacterium]
MCGGAINLTGVPQTTLWSFWYRASEAKKDNPVIRDETAVAALNRVSYDFEGTFGEPDVTISLRSIYSDVLIREFLQKHPDGTVIVLGEGLETQFWRTDNGRVLWYTVDLPETIQVREKFFPGHERNTHISCSALDPGWSQNIEKDRPVFISTSGLLMYFKPSDVLQLLQHISTSFPGAQLFMDIVPPFVSFASRFGVPITDNFRMPRMHFGVTLSRAAKFFEKAGGLTVDSVVSFTEAFPDHNRELAVFHKYRWLRDIFIGGFVHAKVGNNV